MRLQNRHRSGLFCSPGVVCQTNFSVGPCADGGAGEGELDEFYQKCVMAGPLPIVGSDKPSDHALLETRYL